jgi:two-component system chemotaxis sensor kinase CheA
MPVVVCAARGREIGLVVDRILDIVEESVVVRPAEGTGVVGCAVIQQRVTDLLDVDALVSVADPSLFGSAGLIGMM